jgi:hypothetical protein
MTVATSSALFGRSLKASDTQPAGDVRPTKQFGVVTAGVVVAQADVMISKAPTTSAIYVDSLMSGGEFASSVSFAKNGHFMYFNGANPVDTGVAFQPGVWYRVTVTTDVVKRTYAVTVQLAASGKVVVSKAGAAWRSTLAGGLDRVRFDTSDGDPNVNLYIDNVRVVKK